MTRRTLLACAAAPLLHAAQSAVRLGGPIFIKSTDPRELAREHRRLGYSAAYCPAVDLKDSARIAAIHDAFQAEDVVISEVGAWKNMLDPDAAARKANLDYVIERMALAEAVGASCCVDIAGSFDPKVWYGPHEKNLSKEFFDATVANVRTVLDAVKPKRSKFSVEMMGWSIPNTADSYLKLIRAVERPGFAVHIDVCNTVNSPEKFYDNAALIHDLFSKLGPWIVSCHAKDLAWIPEMNIHFQEVVPGRGKLDYRAYLNALAALPHPTPLMLEHLSKEEEYTEGRGYIQRVAREAGIRLA